MKPINVLITLHRGYGLGDAVQMSAVLRHVQKYRPNWVTHYQAEEGRHQVARGLTAGHFAHGRAPQDYHYDAEVLVCLYDTWANWGDRPNTRVCSCLHEHFGLPWDRECGRYQVRVREESAAAARGMLGPLMERGVKTRSGVVAVHYQGDSSQAKKNLTHEQAAAVCRAVKSLGRTPLLLDWRNASPLVDQHTVRGTGRFPFSQEWGRDAEMNCAVIAQCEAFVGIDSGPGKCASATDTPALVVWTGHHPAPFHDPAPNTTHLVPADYHGFEPVWGDGGVIRWFETNYRVLTYDPDCGPLPEVRDWLREVLQ